MLIVSGLNVNWTPSQTSFILMVALFLLLQQLRGLRKDDEDWFCRTAWLTLWRLAARTLAPSITHSRQWTKTRVCAAGQRWLCIVPWLWWKKAGVRCQITINGMLKWSLFLDHRIRSCAKRSNNLSFSSWSALLNFRKKTALSQNRIIALVIFEKKKTVNAAKPGKTVNF